MVTESEGSIAIARAEEIASDAFGRQINLKFMRRFAATKVNKSTVIRCSVENENDDLPPTVIVKQAHTDGGRGDIGFLNEWASYRFLSALPLHRPMCANYLGADKEQAVLLLEDLGDGEGGAIEEILEDGDRDLAEEVLEDYSRTLGRLHAETSGRAEEFYRIREGLGPMAEQPSLYTNPWNDARRQSVDTDEIAEVVKCYRSVCESVSVVPKHEIEAEIARTTRAVEEHPERFLTFGQGDQNGLGGFIRKDGKLRIFDFDCGGFRHALREGIPARTTWGGMKCVPRHVQENMEQAYRDELAKGCPHVSSDTEFARAKLEASAHWHIFHVNVRLHHALESDRDRQRGPSTLRQQVIAWLRAFAEISEETNDLLGLGRCAREILSQLKKQWGQSCMQLPKFGAFK